MTAKSAMPLRRIGAVVGALLLVCGAAPALSQSANNSDKAAAARTSSKPKAAAKRAASPTATGARGGGSDYWSIDYALPNRYDGARKRNADRNRAPEVTTEINSEFGRVPVQTGTGRGSIGLASGRVRASELDDGRPVPGLTANTRQESSYVGLSLSVTSDNKSFPVPVPMPWNRWE